MFLAQLPLESQKWITVQLHYTHQSLHELVEFDAKLRTPSPRTELCGALCTFCRARSGPAGSLPPPRRLSRLQAALRQVSPPPLAAVLTLPPTPGRGGAAWWTPVATPPATPAWVRAGLAASAAAPPRSARTDRARRPTRRRSPPRSPAWSEPAGPASGPDWPAANRFAPESYPDIPL